MGQVMMVLLCEMLLPVASGCRFFFTTTKKDRGLGGNTDSTPFRIRGVFSLPSVLPRVRGVCHHAWF